VTIVRLGAWCDYVAQVEETTSFRVREFAELDDGSRLFLDDPQGGERGFSSRVSVASGGRSQPVDPWAYFTVADVEASVLTTVLPNDDDSGEEHPWEWLTERLAEYGLEASADQLRELPYVVELGPRLRARLGDAGA
jgi:hypothetical protein